MVGIVQYRPTYQVASLGVFNRLTTVARRTKTRVSKGIQKDEPAAVHKEGKIALQSSAAIDSVQLERGQTLEALHYTPSTYVNQRYIKSPLSSCLALVDRHSSFSGYILLRIIRMKRLIHQCGYT
eukprot:gb/GECG01014129.1/.p1 GENE.gb/GECG01014129.1/~~gb/GECG01014129.1/.p1  ORF type:complete len:125 (+),score=5.47 gb/GECG01014129.1/:1-375(+)